MENISIYEQIEAMKHPYIIRDREAGNAIEHADTMEEAERIVAKYEAEDKQDGTYTEDFYEIIKR